MRIGSSYPLMRIAGSGLSAERKRMEVAANNIANAHTTRTADGGAYRRRDVVFASVMATQDPRSADGLAGVEVVGIEADNSEMPSVYNPGHPDADENGMVEMPNVSIPNEMIDMMTASRAYEANVRVLTTIREMVEQTLSLLRTG